VSETITSYVGLDIHKASIAIAVAEAGRAAPRFIGTINPVPSELCKALRRQRCSPGSTLLVYEAGPCGYGWMRYLRKQGWRCEVIAPSRITRSVSERRLKTDRRDALMLARQCRAGDLTAIVVPDERAEAIRDLSRAREDACAARLRVRQQMKALLLRHGRDYVRYNSWSQAHERHLATIRCEHPAQAIAFNEYRAACQEACERVERITGALRELCQSWRLNPVVEALMCLKGFDFVAAVTFVAESGDLNRFKAQITRTLQVRQQGQLKRIREISWKAQLRLSKRWRSLGMTRKINHNKICVAIARELSGFIWDVARHVTIKP